MEKNISAPISGAITNKSALKWVVVWYLFSMHLVIIYAVMTQLFYTYAALGRVEQISMGFS